MITATINGKEIKLEKPTTILEAAKKNGIKIPHFCHHEVLEAWGGCRMCLVEVEKMPRLQAACTLYVTEGMIVRTESPQITQARKSSLEFLLANHPLDCPVCDKAGECKLQDYTMKYGPTEGRFEEGKLKNPESLADPLIVRNPERCILCTRCVRMCDGVQGASAIAIMARGNKSVMEPFSGGKYDCEYCGNCLTVCPVGAIMSKLHRYKYRSWQVEKSVKTVCSYCGVGCTMTLEIRNNAIMRTMPKIGLGSNKGLLCNRGRFGYEYVGSGERLATPMIRKGAKLQPASWDEALSLVAERLSAIKGAHGGKAIAGIASARCTNEENYVFQKLIRGLQSNNIDSASRMGYAGGQRIIDEMLGQGATANLVSALPGSDAIVVIGGDPTKINPVLGINIRMAHRRGAKVITIGYAPGLSRHRTMALMPSPGAEHTVVGGLIAGLKSKPMPGKNTQLEEKISALTLPSVDDAARAAGVQKEQLEALIKELSDKSSVSVVIGRDISAHAGKAALVSLLSYVLGAKVYLMSERPNEQGLLDAGCAPDMLPGGGMQADALKKKCEEAWRFQIPAEAGLTLMEMIEAASKDVIKAMYVMGENPAFSLPDSSAVKKALGKLDFLVVQDLFMSETAEMAHVVLPAYGWAEKDGTYTNLERKIQVLSKGVAGNEKAMEDWKIIAEVGKKLGLHMPYDSAGSIMTEIASVSPLYAGLSYADIDGGLGFWPYRFEPSKNGFKYTDPAVSSSSASGLYLMIERPLFHSGTLSRMSPALNGIHPEATAIISPKTAEGLSIKDGGTVKVSSDKGSVTLKAKVMEGAPDSAVLLSNNFKGKGVMGLMGYTIEPNTKAPIPAASNIRIEVIGG